jgi:hypothetical protein
MLLLRNFEISRPRTQIRNVNGLLHLAWMDVRISSDTHEECLKLTRTGMKSAQIASVIVLTATLGFGAAIKPTFAEDAAIVGAPMSPSENIIDKGHEKLAGAGKDAGFVEPLSRPSPSVSTRTNDAFEMAKGPALHGACS